MFGASLVVLFVIRAVMGLRVSEQEEFEGMDVHECGMLAYPEFVSFNTQEAGTASRGEATAKRGVTGENKPALR